MESTSAGSFGCELGVRITEPEQLLSATVPAKLTALTVGWAGGGLGGGGGHRGGGLAVGGLGGRGRHRARGREQQGTDGAECADVGLLHVGVPF